MRRVHSAESKYSDSNMETMTRFRYFVRAQVGDKNHFSVATPADHRGEIFLGYFGR